MLALMGNPRQIATPRDNGEVRIPALGLLAGEVVCFYDVRPAPAGGDGRKFTGEVMASDLPNPNRLAYVELTGEHELTEHYFRTPEPIASDACVASDPEHITVAYASVDSPVSYISSRFCGPRLASWVAVGDARGEFTHRRLDVLYDETHADALFATSGSTIMFDGSALIPYVMRHGEKMSVRVAHLRNGELVALSEPVAHPSYSIDETSLALDPDLGIILNARVQGFEGKGAGGRLISYSEDGVTFSPLSYQRLLDPGCNAKALGELFIHPHSLDQRANGAIVDMVSGEIVYRFDEGEFGYSDAIWHNGRLTVVAERHNELWQWELALTSSM